MPKRYLLVVILFFLTKLCIAQKRMALTHKKIVTVELKTDIVGLGDSIALMVTQSPNEDCPYPQQKLIKQHAQNLNWLIQADDIIEVEFNNGKFSRKTIAWMLEPGDSIVICHMKGKCSFSGRGAEKLNLEMEIDSIIKNMPKPLNSSFSVTTSVDDYLSYNEYLRNLWLAIESRIQSYKGEISKKALESIKIAVLGKIDNERVGKFHALYLKYVRDSSFRNIDGNTLSIIYDSTFFHPSAVWMRSQSSWSVGSNSYYGFIREQVMRKSNFSRNFFKSLSQDGRLNRRLLYFKQGAKDYRGLAKEYFLYKLVTSEIVDEYGVTPEVEKVLMQYYSISMNFTYKCFMRDYVRNSRILKAGSIPPDFAALDMNGTLHSSCEFRGKIMLLHFDRGDDVNTRELATSFKSIENHFEQDSNFVFLRVSTGERWERSTSNVINLDQNISKPNIRLYLTSITNEDSLAKSYNLAKASTFYLLNEEGKIVMNPLPDPRTNKDSLIQLISRSLNHLAKKRVALLNDGPYVLKKNNVILCNQILNGQMLTKQLAADGNEKLKVRTDLPNSYFEVSLKRDLTIEPSEYEQPEKILALSDIEGNFDALREVLQGNNVIDRNCNWSFGRGHLVLIGDMIDRGSQVTECLWLIYSLEEKAKLAGGYVHFILGNHEIMNLNGDSRYGNKKYLETVKKLGLSYVDLWGTESEIGRWLRTKNIVERIGNLLFVHGGISKEVNELGLAVSEINRIARPYYDKNGAAKFSGLKALSVLYDPSLSPFWYRLYYLEESRHVLIRKNGLDTIYRASPELINSTLLNFKVDKIITGHTICKNENNYGQYVSIHYNGKVINTDTKHAVGKTEALLIENRKYYRVDRLGNRQLLQDFIGEPREFVVH